MPDLIDQHAQRFTDALNTALAQGLTHAHIRHAFGWPVTNHTSIKWAREGQQPGVGAFLALCHHLPEPLALPFVQLADPPLDRYHPPTPDHGDLAQRIQAVGNTWHQLQTWLFDHVAGRNRVDPASMTAHQALQLDQLLLTLERVARLARRPLEALILAPSLRRHARPLPPAEPAPDSAAPTADDHPTPGSPTAAGEASPVHGLGNATAESPDARAEPPADASPATGPDANARAP